MHKVWITFKIFLLYLNRTKWILGKKKMISNQLCLKILTILQCDDKLRPNSLQIVGKYIMLSSCIHFSSFCNCDRQLCSIISVKGWQIRALRRDRGHLFMLRCRSLKPNLQQQALISRIWVGLLRLFRVHFSWFININIDIDTRKMQSGQTFQAFNSKLSS